MHFFSIAFTAVTAFQTAYGSAVIPKAALERRYEPTCVQYGYEGNYKQIERGYVNLWDRGDEKLTVNADTNPEGIRVNPSEPVAISIISTKGVQTSKARDVAVAVSRIMADCRRDSRDLLVAGGLRATEGNDQLIVFAGNATGWQNMHRWMNYIP